MSAEAIQLPDDQGPAPAIRFTEREIDFAHQLAALGIDWIPRQGSILYLDNEDFLPGEVHLPGNICVLLSEKAIARSMTDPSAFRNHATWLPTWQEGRDWLRAAGKSDAEVLDRVRERVAESGFTDLEVLYELIASVLRSRTSA